MKVTLYQKIFFSMAFLLAVSAFPALAADTPAAPAANPAPPTASSAADLGTLPIDSYYKYANNEAEYSVALPEAPTVETIWADTGDVPYLENCPESGSVGETATFKRVDMETEDYFEAKIIFLKADKAFLKSLTEKKMRETLQKDYKTVLLNDAKFTFSASAGDGALKWAALSGFTIDKSNQPIFHAAHYLTGQQSIMVIKVEYNIDNKTYQGFYKNLVDNITYHAP
jgi:hypothetical protein